MNQARTNPHGPTWDSVSAHRRAVVAEQQRDALAAQLKAVEDRTALEQAVIDAAVEWHKGSTETNPTPGRGLADAVAAYLRG